MKIYEAIIEDHNAQKDLCEKIRKTGETTNNCKAFQ